MSPSTLNPLEAALQALRVYEPGSSRGDLLRIDAAVRSSFDHPARRRALEERLLSALEEASMLGQVYLLKQLARVGSERAIAKIADRLLRPELADEACRTLAVLPSRESGDALRQHLPRLAGNARIGAIHALGWLRDARSVEPLAVWCSGEEEATARAALTALGRIGTPDAAKVLMGCLPDAREAFRATLTEAAMDCADGLFEAGHTSEAQALVDAVAESKKRWRGARP